MNKTQFNQLLNSEIKQMCKIALIEDLAGASNQDITAKLIPENKDAVATLITRENGILCGVQWVNTIFESFKTPINIKWNFNDGDAIQAGDTICTISGNAQAILTGERAAMNFLQTLSATASITHKYSKLINGTNCQLLDTRKTIPGMRFGQKYAVKCGGGVNHRFGLSDAYLIKENHIMACGGIKQALETAINNNPNRLLEIEVENLGELQQALDGQAQVVMLDNFSNEDMKQAVAIRNNHENQAKLEASGNVSINTIESIANTGVDYISVGALTKNIDALDLSLRIVLN